MIVMRSAGRLHRCRTSAIHVTATVKLACTCAHIFSIMSPTTRRDDALVNACHCFNQCTRQVSRIDCRQHVASQTVPQWRSSGNTASNRLQPSVVAPLQMGRYPWLTDALVANRTRSASVPRLQRSVARGSCDAGEGVGRGCPCRHTAYQQMYVQHNLQTDRQKVHRPDPSTPGGVSKQMLQSIRPWDINMIPANNWDQNNATNNRCDRFDDSDLMRAWLLFGDRLFTTIANSKDT